jgi:6-phosphofructokinase 1
MRRIGVLTSGGDAPGMNAAIRAVVRTGYCRGLEVLGVRHGFKGLIDGDFTPLRPRDVGGILQRGGTLLGSARCEEFRTLEGRSTALRELERHNLTGLVVIGGSGSQQGAFHLSEMGFPVVGIASTIDNDLYGADITIGVTTALDIVIEAADRLRVTASSHNRAFLIEVMGRDCGYLAMIGGIASGAEAIVIPEAPTTPEQLAGELREAYARGKPHALVIVAEGAPHDADALARYFAHNYADLGFDLRVTKLGHMQRGGAPGVFDRMLATLLGDAATERLARGEHAVMMGPLQGAIKATSLAEVVSKKKGLDLGMLDLARSLTV